MKAEMPLRSRWVLVTGASSGLGKEMAQQLASRYGANLILVARRATQLQELALALEQRAGVRCHVIVADLSVPADVEKVFAEATSVGDIQAVILNAGITHFGLHTDLGWAGFQAMLATNVSSVVRLMSLFTPYLISKKQGGGMMVISSMAGLLPVPFQAAYAGTKAFVTNFAQSLSQELHDQNISVTVFSPGGIDTEMTHNSGLKYFENTLFLQDVESCAREGLQAMCRRRALYVPGLLNRQQLMLARLVPRSLIGFVTRKTYRKALQSA